MTGSLAALLRSYILTLSKRVNCTSLLFIVLPISFTHWSDPMVMLGWGPSQCSERHCSANVRCIRAKGIRWCDQRVVHVSGASLYILLHHSMLSISHLSIYSIALNDLCHFTESTLPALNHPYKNPCCAHADSLHFIRLFHSHPHHPCLHPYPTRRPCLILSHSRFSQRPLDQCRHNSATHLSSKSTTVLFTFLLVYLSLRLPISSRVRVFLQTSWDSDLV